MVGFVGGVEEVGGEEEEEGEEVDGRGCGEFGGRVGEELVGRVLVGCGGEDVGRHDDCGGMAVRGELEEDY